MNEQKTNQKKNKLLINHNLLRGRHLRLVNPGIDLDSRQDILGLIEDLEQKRKIFPPRWRKNHENSELLQKNEKATMKMI